MSLGAERRLESRLGTLEDMIRDPKSAINLESLLVSPHESSSWVSNASVFADTRARACARLLVCGCSVALFSLRLDRNLRSWRRVEPSHTDATHRL